MNHATQWRQHGALYVGDDQSAGDDQVGNEYSRRFTNPAQPRLIVDVRYCVIATGADAAENPPPDQRELAVIELIEYTANRPDGSEQWSGGTRDDDADPNPCGYHNLAKAEQAAADLSRNFDPYRIDWDGEPFTREPAPYSAP